MNTPYNTPKKPNFKINQDLVIPPTPKKPRELIQDATNGTPIQWDFAESVSLEKEMNFFYYIGPNKTSLVIKDTATYLSGSAAEDRYGNFVFRLQTNSVSLKRFANEVKGMNPGDWDFSPAGVAMEEGLLIIKMKITPEGMSTYMPKQPLSYASRLGADNNDDYVSPEDVKRFLEKQQQVTVKFGVGIFFNVAKKSYGLFIMVRNLA